MGEPGIKSNIRIAPIKKIFARASRKKVFLNLSEAFCSAGSSNTTNGTPATNVQCGSMPLLKEKRKKKINTPKKV
jgi:hypothetical protein